MRRRSSYEQVEPLKEKGEQKDLVKEAKRMRG